MEDWVHEHAALDWQVAGIPLYYIIATILKESGKYTLQAKRMEHIPLGFTMYSSRDVAALDALNYQCLHFVRDEKDTQYASNIAADAEQHPKTITQNRW